MMHIFFVFFIILFFYFFFYYACNVIDAFVLLSLIWFMIYISVREHKNIWKFLKKYFHIFIKNIECFY